MRQNGLFKVFFLLCVALASSQCGPHSQRNSSAKVDVDSVTVGTLVFHLSDRVKVQIPISRTSAGLALNNGPETIVLVPIDSSCYRVPVFDGTVCLDSEGKGSWTDVMRTGETPYSIDIELIEPVTWVVSTGQSQDTQTWRLAFGNDDPWFGDLILNRSTTGRLEGTIETATGDFRYLHGEQRGDTLTLQTFDGAHLFHFSADNSVKDSLLNGVFSSGSHYSTPFVAHIKTELDTPLASGNMAAWTSETIGYNGKDLSGNATEWAWSPSDSSTHVLSVMGSWCPNCMDEHRLLAELMDAHPTMHVHTLAFERGLERPNGEGLALTRLRQYAESMDLLRFGERWHIILAGPASKKEAQVRLPFLDKVVSFPTSIVLAPGANEPWIHSGFNGPATGDKYDTERARFSEAVNGPTESR